MQLSFSKVVITIGDLVKQSRPGTHVEPLSLTAYAAARRLCIVTVFKEYLRRTLDIKGKETRLLLAIVTHHAAVSKDTVTRRMKATVVLIWQPLLHIPLDQQQCLVLISKDPHDQLF